MQAIKILLVADDEEDYIQAQNLLSTGIATQRYHLTWCNRYSDAINAMLKNHFDLYLVNYKIGIHCGLNLLKEAVASNCTRPIIILSREGDKNIDEAALEAGAADYLTEEQTDSETLERSIRYATRQSETVERLKQSEHTFRTLFERSKDPILISDPKGNILDANKSALNFFGLDYSDISEINAAFFYRIPKERQTFIEVMQRDGAINDMLVELITVHGETKTCSITSFIEIPQHGDSELYYTFVRDLSYSPELSLSNELKESHYDLKNQLPQSIEAVRVSLSKITKALDKRADLESCTADAAFLDTIRINASFADHALKNLREQLDRT